MGSTLLVVQSFKPYAEMCYMNLPHWRKHGLPVTIISPEDSYCIVEGVACVPVGPEGYTGRASLDRWRAMLQWMLKQPYQFFMMHESDSICLRPEIPHQYFQNPYTLYSNEMPDNAVPPRQQFYSVAPWFMHRSSIEQILATSIKSPDREPYHGDRWMGQMMEVGRIRHAPFSPGVGCGTLGAEPEMSQVCECVRNGAFMIHGIKTPYALNRILEAWNERRA